MSCVTVTAEFLPMRLWSSVSIPTDNTSWLTKCWPWRGAVPLNRKTGKLQYGRKPFAPHKLAYIMFHGLKVEECAELVVAQSCGNSLCCNPKHLVSDDKSASARQYKALLIMNEARKQASETAPTVPRPALPHDLAERIAREWVRACMSRREVIEMFGIEAWQLDDLKKRMAAGEFQMARWPSQGLQQASGV